jgi:hypothetical protein
MEHRIPVLLPFFDTADQFKNLNKKMFPESIHCTIKELYYTDTLHPFLPISNRGPVIAIGIPGQALRKNKEKKASPKPHVVLEAVGGGTALAGLLQLTRHRGHVGHHHLVHEAAKAQPKKRDITLELTD